MKAKTCDLLFPASAEFVVEGVIRPQAMAPEGPFGEFTGYYGKPEAAAPLVEITAIHYRDKPILTNALMADYPSCEQSGFFSILRSTKIWDDLDKLGVPGITGVYSHPAAAGGFGMTILSLEQKYAGHAAQALALAAQVPGGAYYTKWIVAVDEDVDPTDMDQVLWAMGSRCNPVDDIDILRSTWSTGLGPPEPAGSATLRLQGSDQRLQAASLSADLLKADQAAPVGLRQGRRALTNSDCPERSQYSGVRGRAGRGDRGSRLSRRKGAALRTRHALPHICREKTGEEKK